MYTNAFEFFRVPTSYNTRDISGAAQMLQADGIPKTETEPFRTRLLNPAKRLQEELLTPRDADYDSGESGYGSLAEMLTGVKCCPVPAQAAAGWAKQIPQQIASRSALKKFILGQVGADPWIIQGAAALCTRTAMEAEHREPNRACGIWENALTYWQAFFAAEQVAGSFCCAMQKTAKDKDACAAAWKNFRNELVKDIAGRCAEDYIQQNNGAAVNACLNILQSAPIRLLEPRVYEKTLDQLESSLGVALMKSTKLSEALALWDGLPDDLKGKPSLISTLIAAMTTETERLEIGFGDANLIERAWKHVNGPELERSGDIEIKAALKKFYDQVARLARDVYGLPDDELFAARYQPAVALLKLLPEDFVVATEATTQEIVYPEKFVALLAQRRYMKDLDEAFDEIPNLGSYQAESKGAALWELIEQATPGEDNSGETRQSLTTRALIELRKRGETDFTKRFLEAFPKNQKFHTDDFRDIEDYLDRMDSEPNAALQELLKALESMSANNADTPVTTTPKSVKPKRKAKTHHRRTPRRRKRRLAGVKKGIGKAFTWILGVLLAFWPFFAGIAVWVVGNRVNYPDALPMAATVEGFAAQSGEVVRVAARAKENAADTTSVKIKKYPKEYAGAKHIAKKKTRVLTITLDGQTIYCISPNKRGDYPAMVVLLTDEMMNELGISVYASTRQVCGYMLVEQVASTAKALQIIAVILMISQWVVWMPIMYAYGSRDK